MASSPPTPAVQDYLKAFYYVEETTASLWVSTSQVAQALGVSAPSASAMLRRLTGLGYVVGGDRRGAFALTGPGREAALEVIRHHRLLETYLVRHLGVPVSEVHSEAEILEHHISESLEARIADVLGHPKHDPHGAPIPAVSAGAEATADTNLTDVRVGDRVVVQRVDDRDPSLSRGLERAGIVAEIPLEVLELDPHGSVRIRVGGGDSVHLPAAAARAVCVSRAA